MAEKAADSGDDSMFAGIELDGIDDSLLTVDVAEGETVPDVDETIKEVTSGGTGDPPKTGDDDPRNPGKVRNQ